jgi:DNA modification methylase
MKLPDQLEAIQIDALIPYARNSRTHSDGQVAQIASSIKEFGFTNPVLIDGGGGIIAGHGRVLAARKLGMSEVPCIRLDHLTEAQKRAYVIADNRLALNSGWDTEMLKVEFADLQELGFDLELTGFDLDEIKELLAPVGTEGLTDPDDAPPLPEHPRTVPGDIWVMGKHRLLCGDSTSMDALDSLMAGQLADLIFTDPPYGMSYDGGRGKKKFGMIKNDDAKGADLIALVRDALATAKASCKDGASAYVCFPWRTYAEFENAMQSCGMEVNSCIVWDKKSVGLGHQDYRPQHEFIFYSKGGQFYGDRSQSDVWYMSRGSTGAYVHPTQKPVELVEKAIANSSKAGDAVIDCFGGSGSTMIACEKTGRHARLMELDPKYCDVIVKRWQDFTGKIATHAETGEPFAEVTNGNNETKT